MITSDNDDKLIQQWKIKKLIKDLTNAKGNGTSMISLIVPPKDQIARVSKMLNDEYGTASNIKSRVNRLSVLSAITSAVQRLKNYSKVPPNGLVLYCGTILNEENKERKFNLDFEPFKPINTSLYLCDNKFHTQALNELLEEESCFGFIVMDGSGCLFGTLCGSTQTVLHKFSVDLPKKHGRGGQSAVRFARLRVEKRHNYVRKVAETATSLFIANDLPNVAGLVLAGSASFKNELAGSDLLDQRLRPLVTKIVDVSYGGENGFNQAIELSADSLADVKLVNEKRLLSGFMGEIAQDTGKFCTGVKETVKALEIGAVDYIIVWENLDTVRQEIRVLEGDEHVIKVKFSNKKEAASSEEIVSSQLLLEWLAEQYKSFGAKLFFVTNNSQEGAQFVKGFGGIGAVLRYQLNFEELASEESDWSESDY